MDCPICASANGLKDRQELVQHMKTHRDTPDLMIEKIADYVAARGEGTSSTYYFCNINLIAYCTLPSMQSASCS